MGTRTRRVIGAGAAVAALGVAGCLSAAAPAGAIYVPISKVTAAPVGATPVGAAVAVSGDCGTYVGPFPNNRVNAQATSVYVALGRPGQPLVAAVQLPVAPVYTNAVQPWSGSLPIPAGATPGSYLLTAYCLDAANQQVGDRFDQTAYQVLGTAAPTITISTSSLIPPGVTEWTRPPTITVSVTGSKGPGVGTITFSDTSRSTPYGTATLDANGSASIVYSSAPGTKTITAAFAGDARYVPATASLVQQYTSAATTTTITTSKSHYGAGELIDVAVEVRYVRPPANGAAPTGRVLVYDNGGLASIVTLDSTGRGTTTLLGPPDGLHRLAAVMEGNERSSPSGGPGVFIGVGGTAQVTLVGNQPNATVGQPLWWVVVVRDLAGAPVTGTVQFSVNGTDVGAPVPLVNGFAITAPNSGFDIRSYVIEVRYSGNGASIGPASMATIQSVRP